MTMYTFTCPNCGNTYELRKRVTVTQRHCPNCNRPFSHVDIDAQEEQRRREAYERTPEGQKAKAERLARQAEEAKAWQAGAPERERKEQERLRQEQKRLQKLRDEALARRERWREKERLKIIAWVVAALVLLIFFIWIVSRG